MKRTSTLGTALALALSLAACGGSVSTAPVILSAGDSLTDTGVFGHRFTVQGTSAAPLPIWSEVAATTLGGAAPCARYTGTAPGAAVSLNPQAQQCGSFAVAGARINPPGTALDQSPYAVGEQIRQLGSEKVFELRTLVLITGGANDVADLFERWLVRGSSSLAPSYEDLLKEVLSSADVDAAAAAGDDALVSAGERYMAALADRLANTIKTHLIDKSAPRIVVSNLPNLTFTPRIAAVYKNLFDKSPSLAELQITRLNLWVNAFNRQLGERFAAQHAQVAVYDLNRNLTQWAQNPSSYGFSDTTTPACPQPFNLATCRAADLAAAAGGTSWDSKLFADDFHPTPRAHRLAGVGVVELMRTRGWN
jgi:outer membrane lipase/esterase